MSNNNLDTIISLPLVSDKNFEISSLLKMLGNSDIITQFIILLLVSASIISIAVILNKYFQYSALNYKLKLFEQDFWSGQSLHQSYSRVKKFSNNPCVAIFGAGMEEADTPNTIGDINLRSSMILTAMHVARNKEVDKLEKSLTILATIGSYTPFVGLFGMIWGVINSFQSISTAKHVSIAVIAPGMSEALFITAIGIAVALPASVFYNILSNKLNAIINKLDDLTSELHLALIKENFSC